MYKSVTVSLTDLQSEHLSYLASKQDLTREKVMAKAYSAYSSLLKMLKDNPNATLAFVDENDGIIDKLEVS